MKFGRDIESFIRDFVGDLVERNAAVFAGAGMSKAAGYVNWPELLSDIADELGLKIDKEHDLISIAQYHVNERRGRAGINKKILNEFAEKAEPTENHSILSRLPITTFWTTNYDTLLEDALKKALKVVDVKHQVNQLANTRPKRDAVVYKMHGDVDHAAEATLTKEDYEFYYKTHEPFITALSGDLVSKTFLFIGFSFTDPNLDYVLSRLNIQFGQHSRQHYCFIKKQSKESGDDDEIYKYKLRKQELMINDLARYKIKALIVNEYSEITEVLKEIENRFKKKTVFISGSAEEYGKWSREEAQGFIHLLSKRIISSECRIVSGFGWGIGSAVINGSLEAVYEKPDKFSQDQLIMRPFPQFETGKKKLPELWDEYRHNMISLAGIAVFVFGNKKDAKGSIIPANGVKREFEIAVEHGLIPIPVATTGYMAQEIFDDIMKDAKKFYGENDWLVDEVKELATGTLTIEQTINKVVTIIQTINK